MEACVSAALRARFERAMAAVGARHEDGTPAFHALAGRYAEAHRHYHNLAHVASCLEAFDACAALAEQPAEVELALWFHDAVYNPRAKDNEAKSAEVAREALLGRGVDAEVVGRIQRHILATRSHEGVEGDAQLVCELDLSILGAAPEAFEVFEHQIRLEYAHVPDLIYRLGRRRVLKRLSERAPIFRVPELHTRFESNARVNLDRALSR